MGYIGIDIGGTQVKFGLVSQDGCVSETIAFDVAFDGYETPIMDTVMEKLVWYMQEHHLTEENVQGIGVSATGQIDVVNLKCDVNIVPSMWEQKGIFPAYHMNKEHWNTVILDGTVPDDEIRRMIAESYDLVVKK